MIYRLLRFLSLLIAAASPVQAQLIVVSGPDAGAVRTEGLLQLAGFTYRKLAPSAVTPEALAKAHTLVLIHAPLTPPAVSALEQFSAAGGKLVLIGQEGPPELLRAVGKELQPAATPPHSLTPSLPHSLTASPFERGAVISSLFPPGERWEHSWLLQAALAAVDPELAEIAAAGLRRQATELLDGAAAHWARVRERGTLPARESQARLRALQALRAEWDRLRTQAESGQTAGRGDFETTAPALQSFIQQVRAYDMGLTPAIAGEIRGIWIHTYAPTDWDRVARQVKAAGLNCLVVRVGRGGNVIYPSALLPRDAWAEKAGGDEMQRAIDAAHRQGLRFIAWRVNFHMGSAPKAYRDRMAAEDRLVRDSHGVQANFSNPGDPRNTELEFQAMREMVEKYDVDGIQFDYIRYPDAPSFDFDYGPVSRREFERKRGQPVPNWPVDVLSGRLKTEYEDWERENINHLVERVYREVKRLKPRVLVSAAVWRSHRRYRASIKQDWPLWVERGWLDLVVPMDYAPEPETFAATVDAQVALTRGKVPLAAGIGSWLLQTPEELVRQVEIAREAGAAGFVLFAYNAEQIEEQLAGLRAGATATDTWLPLPAPPLRVSVVSPSISPKDAPLAVEVGTPLKVRVAMPAGNSTVTTSATARDGVQTPDRGSARPGSWVAELDTPDGKLIQVLGPVNDRGQTVLAGSSPAGRFQPVVRGCAPLSGGAQPFVARGPLVEGLAPAEIAALRAQERPPVFTGASGGNDGGSSPRIGVYAGGLGAETVLEGLSKQGMRVAAVHRLRPDHLAAVETLILPQLADVAELDRSSQRRLRQWVEGGHILILTHDAVGARWHPRLFPELIQDAEVAPASTLTAAVALEEIPAASRFRHTGSDQFRITPGPAAQVLVREKPGVGDGPSAALGAPVVVAGRVGRGTVILVGFLSGYQEMALDDDEARLLSALARWRAAAAALSR